MKIPALLLILTLAMHVAKVSSISGYPYYMHIINQLSNQKVGSAHCKSKNDDIGYHDIANGDQIAWHFRCNVWASTLFWCNFWKENGTFIASGKVFWEGKIIDRCGDHGDSADCVWYIRDDGIYARDFQKETDVFYYTWGKP